MLLCLKKGVKNKERSNRDPKSNQSLLDIIKHCLTNVKPLQIFYYQLFALIDYILNLSDRIAELFRQVLLLYAVKPAA